MNPSSFRSKERKGKSGDSDKKNDKAKLPLEYDSMFLPSELLVDVAICKQKHTHKQKRNDECQVSLSAVWESNAVMTAVLLWVFSHVRLILFCLFPLLNKLIAVQYWH